MAKITENKGMVEVVVTKEVTTSYTLDLSVEEYVAIAVLVGSLSGPFNSQLKTITERLWNSVFREYYIKDVLESKDKAEDILYNKLRKGLSSHVS